ncbi:MAG: pirin family protein [Verrucomicrobiales bacterium]
MSEISIIKRPSEARGHTSFDWLESKHSFSFGDFYDPEYIGFSALRIMNEDTISAGSGFGMHPHHSMEIFSYVISGTLQHEDSLGNRRKVNEGEFQYMSAASGVMHSEVNASKSEPVHFLQFWIEPDQPGGTPIYAEMDPRQRHSEDGLTLLASNNGRDDSLMVRQDVTIWLGELDANQTCVVKPELGGRNFWIQVIDGDLELGSNQEFLLSGDGAAVSSESGFSVAAKEKSKFIAIEL